MKSSTNSCTVWKADTVRREGEVFIRRAAMVAGPSEWKKPFRLVELLLSMAISNFRNAATPSFSRGVKGHCHNYNDLGVVIPPNHPLGVWLARGVVSVSLLVTCKATCSRMGNSRLTPPREPSTAYIHTE